MRQRQAKWAAAHEAAVNWTERLGAAAALAGGSAMAYYGAGVGSYLGVGLAAIGAFYFFPKIRPLIYSVVRRLPFLKDVEDGELKGGTGE